MTDRYTLRHPIRVVDMKSKYNGKWYVETEENPFMHLSVNWEVVDCLDDDINGDDLYFESRQAALTAGGAYILGHTKPESDTNVTGDIESQPMTF